MAWEELTNGRGYSGDEPLDAFSVALERISRAYTARFGRLPSIYEIAHALHVVVSAEPNRYVSDPENIQALAPRVEMADQLPLVPDDFRASWTDQPEPDGTYFVERVSTGTDAIKCTMRITDRVMYIDYEILDEMLSDADARAIIVSAIIKSLTDDAFSADVDSLSFSNIRGVSKRTVVHYPA
jgi:hypothetical protein